ncbi:DUF4365 domain-containing protein [Chryseobacterium sp. sg2396]|uniref:DUF4365 domain-containing protein n=1 Tax=Chryseobacterium sp. sg2396 TaxID=3276280 RepID=UPI0025F1B6ED|nr:DUF4365 domain-containing protein [uncultured Chryseobacterium sp.]
MTEEQIKEKLSDAFISVIANYKGYKLQKPDDTGGVDFSVTYDKILSRNGKKRYIQSGEYIDLQLKATQEHRIIFEENTLKYDLEAKTYNDLIFRFNYGNAPLILILAILPDNNTMWAQIGDFNLIMNQRVYYFYPNIDMEETNNQTTIRIEIPIANKIDLDFFPNRFQEHYR